MKRAMMTKAKNTRRFSRILIPSRLELIYHGAIYEIIDVRHMQNMLEESH